MPVEINMNCQSECDSRADWDSELDDILGISPYCQNKTSRHFLYWALGAIPFVLLTVIIGYFYKTNVEEVIFSHVQSVCNWFIHYYSTHSQQFFLLEHPTMTTRIVLH